MTRRQNLKRMCTWVDEDTLKDIYVTMKKTYSHYNRLRESKFIFFQRVSVLQTKIQRIVSIFQFQIPHNRQRLKQMNKVNLSSQYFGGNNRMHW